MLKPFVPCLLLLTACAVASPSAEAQVVPLGGSTEEIRRALGLDRIPSTGPVYAGVDIDGTTLPIPATHESTDVGASIRRIGVADPGGETEYVTYASVGTSAVLVGDPPGDASTMRFGVDVFGSVEDAQWQIVELFQGGITGAPRPGPKRARDLGIGDVSVRMRDFRDWTVVYVLASNLLIEASFGPSFPEADFYSALVAFGRYLTEAPRYDAVPSNLCPTIETVEVLPTPVHAYGDLQENFNQDYTIHLTASSSDGDPIESRQMWVDAVRGIVGGPVVVDGEARYEPDELAADETFYVETITVSVVDLRGVITTVTYDFTVIEPLVESDEGD